MYLAQPKGRCLQGGSKLYNAAYEKCKCPFAYFTVMAVEVEKNNASKLSSRGFSHCGKISV